MKQSKSGQSGGSRLGSLSLYHLFTHVFLPTATPHKEGPKETTESLYNSKCTLKTKEVGYLRGSFKVCFSGSSVSRDSHTQLTIYTVHAEAVSPNKHSAVMTQLPLSAYDTPGPAMNPTQ